jgi:hypothetical protein
MLAFDNNWILFICRYYIEGIIDWGNIDIIIPFNKF